MQVEGTSMAKVLMCKANISEGRRKEVLEACSRCGAGGGRE